MEKEKLKSSGISLLKDILWALGVAIIVFGGMYLILGPPFPPILAVVSQSMYHADDSWKEWFIKEKINYSNFPFIDGFDRGDIIITRYSGLLADNVVNLGDVVVYERDNEHKYPNNVPIIHRVVGIIEIKEWKYYNHSGTLECITEEEIERDIENVKICNGIIDGECIYKNFPKTGNFTFYITKGDNNKVSDQCGNMPYTPMHLIPKEQIITKGWILIPKIGYLKIWLNEAIDFINPF